MNGDRAREGFDSWCNLCCGRMHDIIHATERLIQPVLVAHVFDKEADTRINRMLLGYFPLIHLITVVIMIFLRLYLARVIGINVLPTNQCRRSRELLNLKAYDTFHSAGGPHTLAILAPILTWG
jgi:hypothetical protein